MDINSKNISFFNQPQLHFSTDKGSWEKEKLGLNISLTTGKLDANASNKNGEYAFFTCNKETLKTDTYAFDCDAILINGNGDLGFTRKYSGKFNAYQRTYVLTNFKHNFDYLEEVIKKYLPEKVLQEAFGGAMPYIRANTITNLDIYTPSMEVQEKVSYLLSNIEDKINKQEILLNKLKNTKAALLVKMFPQNNEDMPALRFAGFTETWEQCKLSEIGSFSKGNGYSKSDLKDIGIPLILYGRLYTHYETLIKEVNTFAEEKQNSVYSKGGEVIIPASGETAEDISIASVVQHSNVLLGGDLNVIQPNDFIDPVFLALSITYSKTHYDLSKLAQGKTVVHIHNPDIKSVNFSFPNKIEQEKISNFFLSLDYLITLHQRKSFHLNFFL